MEEQIEQLKNALREVVSLISQRGQPLSEEVKAMLVQVMEHVAERIQELRQGEEAPITSEPPLEPGIPSSNINSFGYDDKNQRLLVKFQGDYPQQNGPVYAYTGIPKVIFDLFQKGAIPARTDGKNKWGRWWRGKVPSLGASLYTLIKNGGYPYQKLS